MFSLWFNGQENKLYWFKKAMDFGGKLYNVRKRRYSLTLIFVFICLLRTNQTHHKNIYELTGHTVYFIMYYIRAHAVLY